MSAIRKLVVLMIVVVVAGCGGGGGSDGTLGLDTGIGGSGGGAGTPGVVVGPYQGAGSIIINDRRLTTGNAEFEVEDGASELDLREGQRLIVFADLEKDEAERVVYRSDIKGPVTASTIIDPLTARADLQVLGQRVLTNSATRFDGVTLTILAPGDLVEVSGSANADGELVATFIGLEAPLLQYKVVGVITSLDQGAMLFDLGGLQVDYGSAALSGFQGAALADGQRVEVRMDPADFTPPANALASGIELLTSIAFEDGEEVEYEGFVDRFVSATDFDIEGLGVTTNGNTEFVNGDPGSVGLNAKLEAEGTINASGVLVADRIIVKPTGAVRVEGTVSAVDEAAGTVTTAVGLTFEIRALTELKDDRDGVEPFTLADIQAGPNGDYVEIRGFIDGQTLVAAELDRNGFSTRTRMRGPVTAEDEAAGSVDILNVTVTGADGVTNYDGGSRAQFHAQVEIGTFVEAEWDPFSSTAAVADKLSIESEN